MGQGGMSDVKDIGAALTLQAAAQFSVTAAAPGGAVTTDPIDTCALTPQQFESIVLALTVGGSKPVATGLSYALSIEHADDNGSGAPGAFAAAPSSHQPATAAAAVYAAAGGNYRTLLRYDLRVSELKRWVRAVLTPTFTGGGAGDTAIGTVTFVAGGATWTAPATRTRSWTPTYLST